MVNPYDSSSSFRPWTQLECDPECIFLNYSTLLATAHNILIYNKTLFKHNKYLEQCHFWDVTYYFFAACVGCYLRIKLFLVHRFLSPWWWRGYVPPKRRFLEERHDATSQKIAFFIVTAVMASNPTTNIFLTKICTLISSLKSLRKTIQRVSKIPGVTTYFWLNKLGLLSWWNKSQVWLAIWCTTLALFSKNVS
jgi:hypothetical protein